MCLEYSDLGGSRLICLEVCIDYSSGAEACMRGMHGRKYDGQVVHMSSVDEETWQNLAK